MKWHPDVVQMEGPWTLLHIGKVTASTLDAIISPTWKIRDSEGFKTFVYKKAAEVYRKSPLPGFTGSWATEQGMMREDEAIAFAALTYEWRITKMGFCETDDGRAGCSPDGLIGDHSGIEMKCPEPHTHVKYLCEGVLPKEYAAQVHGSMFVTGRPEWVFFSYSRGFPPFTLTVHRDEEVIKAIGEAVEKFAEELDRAVAKLRAGTAPRQRRAA